MKKNNIFLMALCILTPFAIFAQHSIRGTVTDTLGQPVYGAVVKIKDTYKATYSNYDGKYMLSDLADGNYTLELDILGYQNVSRNVTISGNDKELNFTLLRSTNALDEVVIKGTRVDKNAPVAHTNLNKEDYEKINLGQDMAYMIRMTPSVVSTSDAGAGVGYTGFRIRGSDGTRINVTVNGIPINDAESHGTFWVNMPDFASSTENIQIQRGVGSSTNGAAAFGATVNLQTDLVSDSSYAELSSSYGSFNTNKNTLRVGTGLINNWSFDGRLSSITSDGYIDRATSDLSSYFLQGGYYGEKTIVKAITFSGRETTYQSWYGTPQAKLENDEQGILRSIENNWFGSTDSANLVESGRTYNYYTYDNEVDNYGQDHYQLHFTHEFNSKLNANASLHYTRGQGYYEQFRNQDALSSYGLEALIFGTDTIRNSDIIRRRWLDNHFFGGVYNINYKLRKANLSIGGGYNQYVGDHFGEIIWAEFASDSEIRDRFYSNFGNKQDFNSYIKADFEIIENLTGYADIQVRNINYVNVGTDIDQRWLDVDTSFLFVNPKFGLTYNVKDNLRTYFSFAVANREPVRNDFIDNPQNDQPKHETLYDYELGVEYTEKKYFGMVNLYFMDYRNQLVLTGALNDVGAAIRDNVEFSYRAGVEFMGGWKITKEIDWNINLTYSQNKIASFKEFITDYDNGVIENEYKDSDISFSPDIIAASILSYKPIRGLEFALQSKYVSEQYLDNTSSSDRMLDAYFVHDLIASYSFKALGIDQIMLNVLVNNITNEMYSSNGYTWGFISGGERVSENWLYPQAGTNVLAGVTARF
jgi:iron complex outermembrane receptor protein